MRFVMGKKGTSKIKRYVDSGGYLFTEDWELEEIIEPEWGDVLWHSTYLREQDVPVLPKPGAGTHPYLRKIFVKPPTKKDGGGTSVEDDVSQLNHVWHIDQDSPAIAIKNKQRVTVLMFSETIAAQSKKPVSEEEKKSYLSGSDAVAVTFLSGGGSEPDPVSTGRPIPQSVALMKGGRVVHVLAHFGKQRGDEGGEKGEYTLQNLLVNFLIEANERRVLKGGK
ncbi:MAG: hypothetical protein HYY16_04245 [Planctomycetes bacterium]|nr:hypothetical protein [Planctomycetota bacterium]